MPGPLSPGACFQLSDASGQRSHFWIVITKPEGAEQNALCVNITDQSNCEDAACVLFPGEHPAVTKKSAIYYQKAMILPLSELDHLGYPRLRAFFRRFPLRS